MLFLFVIEYTHVFMQLLIYIDGCHIFEINFIYTTHEKYFWRILAERAT